MVALLALQPAADPARAQQVNSAFWLLVAVGAFLLGGMAVLVITIAARRIRWARERTAPRPEPRPHVDAWAESARRLETTDPPGTPVELSPARQTSAAAAARPARRGVARISGEPGGQTDLESLGSTGRPIVMITGAARRIGRAIANSFAVAGCDVLITFNSSREEAEITAAELEAHGVLAAIAHADFDDDASADLFARRVASALPRLDVLVHNASVYAPSPLDELDAAAILRNYRVNAMSPLLLTARLSRLLANSGLAGGGSVVAMCDMHAMGRPRKDFAAYAMSKAALIEMVRSLARDLAPLVRVNGVAPGVVAWPDEGYESQEDEQQKYIRRIPLGRSGTPEEAADVVRWLALEATYITGEVIRIDGGRWLT